MLKDIIGDIIVVFAFIGLLSLIIVPVLHSEKEEYRTKLIEHGIATFTVDIYGHAEFVYLKEKGNMQNGGTDSNTR